MIQADARHIPLQDESVQCVVTSPPYWGLRDYGIEGQIGLEATPEEYVQKIVEVFREVRRVCRKDAIVWLNLGDSYFDKQLQGIPWKVAFALQQPYYTGSIKRVEDRIWLAAMIDGEGCMFIHKRKAGTDSGAKFTMKDGTEKSYIRNQDTYGSGLEVANVHRAILERCLEITGIGSTCTVERETRTKKRNIPLHRWNVRSNECRKIIREIYPYLVGKQHEARLLLGCPSSGKQAELAHAGLIALHRGYTPPIDFPAPESMYEPGWYLRSDIIWSKKNPMPESVTDRPTKSHEYIFLLTKSEDYFCDMEAVKEPSIQAGREDTWWRPSRGQENGRANHSGNEQNHEKLVTQAYRNKRSVWEVATQPYPEAHFATFPEDLIKPCILAGTSQRGACVECGAPWERVVEKESYPTRPGLTTKYNDDGLESGRTRTERIETITKTLGFKPTCSHTHLMKDAAIPYPDKPNGFQDSRPCIVLDPFAGSGTTVKVAQDLGRIGIGLDLKPDYIRMAKVRAAQLGLMV